MYGVRCLTDVLPLPTHLGFSVYVEHPELLGVFNYQKVTTQAGGFFFWCLLFILLFLCWCEMSHSH